jgi:hypothetical protein
MSCGNPGAIGRRFAWSPGFVVIFIFIVIAIGDGRANAGHVSHHWN